MNVSSFFGNDTRNAGAYEVACMGQFYLMFQATNFCYYNCAHCSEQCGLKSDKSFIDQEIIKSYIEQALADPFYARRVIYTGGEIFAAHEFKSIYYVPDLLKFSITKGIGTDIKTNAAWMDFPVINQEILAYIKGYSRMNTKPNGFQISTSVDKYHKNSVKNATKLIPELVNLDNTTNIYIGGLRGQEYKLVELNDNLEKNGISVQARTRPTGEPCLILNGKKVVDYGFSTLLADGRAKNLPDAVPLDGYEYMFTEMNVPYPIIFDISGWAGLCGIRAPFFRTRWKDDRGNPKPLQQIRNELAMLVRNAERSK